MCCETWAAAYRASVILAGTRVVPLPPGLAQAMREWKAVVPANQMNLVFPGPSGGAFSCSGLNAWFRRGGGVHANYSLVSLRAFFVVWCRAGPPDGKGGVTDAQLYRLLGRSIPWSEIHGIAKFGNRPIDLERYAAAERAVFSWEEPS